jgi:hypothetical protein
VTLRRQPGTSSCKVLFDHVEQAVIEEELKLPERERLEVGEALSDSLHAPHDVDAEQGLGGTGPVNAIAWKQARERIS